jgi:hypothetical protein
MARTNREVRSFRQLGRFHRVINTDGVFGTHSGRVQDMELQSKMDRGSRSRACNCILSKLVASAAPLISHNRNSSCACGTGVFINEQLTLSVLTFGGCQ